VPRASTAFPVGNRACAAAIVCAAALCACGASDVGTLVGPEGAVVMLPGGGRLEIPAGALVEPVRITAVEVDPPGDRWFVAAGTFVRLGPEDLSFRKAARVTFPVREGATDPVVVWSESDAAFVAIPTGTAADRATVSALVWHFSDGGPATGRMCRPTDRCETGVPCQKGRCADGRCTVDSIEGDCDDGDPATAASRCVAGSCRPIPASCGNGIVDGTEECDGEHCLLYGGAVGRCDGCWCIDDQKLCGNGKREPWEVCDGADVAGCPVAHECRKDCRCVSPDEACGNGVLDAWEACEDGAPCAAVDEVCMDCECRKTATCGNGTVEPWEECDGGKACPGTFECSGCRCYQPDLTCGDRNVQVWEECEAHADCTGGKDRCVACRCIAGASTCGDGALQTWEDCESSFPCGRFRETCDKCDCRDVPGCGDGKLAPGEQCETDEDCRAAGKDLCLACECAERSAFCGNGRIDWFEECEGTSCAWEAKACSACRCVPLPES